MGGYFPTAPEARPSRGWAFVLGLVTCIGVVVLGGVAGPRLFGSDSIQGQQVLRYLPVLAGAAAAGVAAYTMKSSALRILSIVLMATFLAFFMVQYASLWTWLLRFHPRRTPRSPQELLWIRSVLVGGFAGGVGALIGSVLGARD